MTKKKKTVDFSRKMNIMGATSMIEARMSRVVSPTRTGIWERGKGPSPRFWSLCLELRSRAAGEDLADCRPRRDGELS